MKRTIQTLLAILFCLTFVQAQQQSLPGTTISGDETWRGTIILSGDVIIGPRGRLVIEPGTKILFEPDQDVQKSGMDKTRAEIVVKGMLIARGTIDRKITFSVNSTSPRMGNWYGINIINPKDKSIIDYVIIEYAHNGVALKKSNPQISNSQIRFNYNAGILAEVYAQPLLSKNIITENGYAGVICNLGAKPILTENLITLNQIGVINFKLSQPNLGSLAKNENYNTGQNRIFENKEYNMYNHSNLPIKAENNSWGYYNRREVTTTIFDAANDAQYGAVDFVPFIRQKERSDLDDYLVMMMDPVSTQAPPQSIPEDQQEGSADTVKTEEKTPEEPPAERRLASVQTKIDPLKAEEKRSLMNVPAINNNKPAETPVEEDNPVEKKIEPEPIANASNNDTEQDLRIPPPREEKKETPQINYNQVFLEPFLDKKSEITRKKAPTITDWGLGAKGIVQIRVIVGKDGRVESTQVLRGLNPYYDRISKEAAEQFLFKPGTINGSVVRFSTNLFFEY